MKERVSRDRGAPARKRGCFLDVLGEPSLALFERGLEIHKEQRRRGRRRKGRIGGSEEGGLRLNSLSPFVFRLAACTLLRLSRHNSPGTCINQFSSFDLNDDNEILKLRYDNNNREYLIYTPTFLRILQSLPIYLPTNLLLITAILTWPLDLSTTNHQPSLKSNANPHPHPLFQKCSNSPPAPLPQPPPPPHSPPSWPLPTSPSDSSNSSSPSRCVASMAWISATRASMRSRPILGGFMPRWWARWARSRRWCLPFRCSRVIGFLGGIWYYCEFWFFSFFFLVFAFLPLPPPYPYDPMVRQRPQKKRPPTPSHLQTHYTPHFFY